MDNFQCKYGLFHDKPCINNEPRSNNGWIYTAQSKYAMGIKYEPEDYYPLWRKCFRYDHVIYWIDRLPGKLLPPISRDEIIGMASLGLPIAGVLDHNKNWMLYNEEVTKNIPFLDTLKSLWAIRNMHRNFFWQEEILEIFPISMKVFPHDRYYLKKLSGIKTDALEYFLFYLYAFSIIFRGSAGEQNLLYLQLKDMGSYLCRFIPYRKNMLKYFGPGHIFNGHLRE